MPHSGKSEAEISIIGANWRGSCRTLESPRHESTQLEFQASNCQKLIAKSLVQEKALDSSLSSLVVGGSLPFFYASPNIPVDGAVHLFFSPPTLLGR